MGRHPLKHNGATTATELSRFDSKGVPQAVFKGSSIRRGAVCYRELWSKTHPRTWLDGPLSYARRGKVLRRDPSTFPWKSSLYLPL